MPVTETIRILYIEDDESSAGIILEYLKRDKFTKFIVKRICTLTDGLKYLDKHCRDEDDCDIDIILLDLILPNSHGVATYNSVVEKSRHIPIVIISGHEDLALKCMKLGAQEYLVKPSFNQEALRRVLRYSFERSKAARERIELERRYREILNHAPIGFHNYKYKDDELYFTGYNPAATDILKINHTELIGKPIEEAFPSLKETNIKEEYIKCIKEGKHFSTELEYSDNNISRAIFNVNAFRTSRNNLTVSFEDITEKVLSDRKYRNLVEATNAGIYEIDFRTGKFVYVNHVIVEQSGYTKEELLNMTAYDILTEESIKKWNSRLAALERGEYVEKTTEYTSIKKDGGLIHIIVTAEYIEDKDGNIIGANVVTIDITESVLAKEEAKRKEEMIFNELEDRIHQWRDELTLNVEKNKLHRNDVGYQLQNLSSQSEVL